MKTAAAKILLSALILSILTASAALAQQQSVRFHWSPSLVIEDGDLVPAESLNYEIWLKRGTETEQMVAFVPDTTFVFRADPGINQYIRVCGVDDKDRRSIMSEWSDPVYFENNGEIVAGSGGAQLRANYPNPFNPETRIVYGVPDDIKSSDVVRLEIFTVQGYRVRVLPVDRSPGWHEVVWDGKDGRGMVTSAGMYVMRFMVGNSVETGKMTMVK